MTRTCGEEDLLRIPNEILDELTPEQICLTPTIVCAYTVLEQFGSKLKPGDSVLLNAAHLSASGSALLQLCKLLKLKPLCMLSLPGSPKNLAKGEYGSKSAWADVDSRAAAPPTVRQQYERISELLVTMGAEEVFPDAVALLRWRDRNQRMLPKLALDGIATRDSCEQLIHCLQSGQGFPWVRVAVGMKVNVHISFFQHLKPLVSGLWFVEGFSLLSFTKGGLDRRQGCPNCGLWPWCGSAIGDLTTTFGSLGWSNRWLQHC